MVGDIVGYPGARLQLSRDTDLKNKTKNNDPIASYNDIFSPGKAAPRHRRAPMLANPRGLAGITFRISARLAFSRH
jgi:hypothetical protein